MLLIVVCVKLILCLFISLIIFKNVNNGNVILFSKIKFDFYIVIVFWVYIIDW